jgi:hypothetical protein
MLESIILPVVRVEDDSPLWLRVAADITFLDGSMTASGLRREVVRGRLVMNEIRRFKGGVRSAPGFGA